MGDFRVFPAPGQAHFFASATLKLLGRKFSKSAVWNFQKYILGMLGPRSRSEIDFLEKKSEIVQTQDPPPFSYMCDIPTS